MVAVEYSVAEFGLPGDRIPENDTVDIRKVLCIFENAGIPCCMSGVSALVWFGAGRVRHDWEICVPSDKVDAAVKLLISKPHNEVYQPWKAELPQPFSMNHLFPRFKFRGVALWFLIIPSDDAYFDIHEVDRSVSDLPYPKLVPFAQSLLDTQRRLELCELIDALNLSEEWGEEYLNLGKMTDVEYARRKNEILATATPPGETPNVGISEKPTPLREMWQEAVRGKQSRIPLELPVEYFATQYFAHGQGDPRLDMTRTYV